MSCDEIDIKRDAGDTYPIEFDLWSQEDRAYIDITGYSFTMEVSSVKDGVPGDSNVVFTMTGTIVDADYGRHRYAPSLSQATDNTGNMFYECRYTDPSGYVRTYRKGQYIVQ